MHERIACIVRLGEQPADAGRLDHACLPHDGVAGIEPSAGETVEERAGGAGEFGVPRLPVAVDLLGDQLRGAQPRAVGRECDRGGGGTTGTRAKEPDGDLKSAEDERDGGHSDNRAHVCAPHRDCLSPGHAEMDAQQQEQVPHRPVEQEEHGPPAEDLP